MKPCCKVLPINKYCIQIYLFSYLFIHSSLNGYETNQTAFIHYIWSKTTNLNG